MATVRVISVYDTGAYVDLVEDQEEGGWSGRCTRCTWDVGGDRESANTADALAATAGHVDQHSG